MAGTCPDSTLDLALGGVNGMMKMMLQTDGMIFLCQYIDILLEESCSVLVKVLWNSLSMFIFINEHSCESHLLLSGKP